MSMRRKAGATLKNDNMDSLLNRPVVTRRSILVGCAHFVGQYASCPNWRFKNTSIIDDGKDGSAEIFQREPDVFFQR